MIKRIGGALFLALSLTVFTHFSFAAGGNAVAKVVFVKGIFTANETRSLNKNSMIYPNDQLKTGESTLAEIVFTDNTFMTFKANSNYRVTNYSFDKNSGKGSFGGKLVTGGFRTLTGLIAKKNPQNYMIDTPVATIGVRGTDYQAVFAGGALYVADYSGVPCVTNNCKSETGPSVANNLLGWVTDPAVHMPQVLAIPDEQLSLVCNAGQVPTLLSALPNFNGASGDTIVDFNAHIFNSPTHFGGAQLKYSLSTSIVFTSGPPPTPSGSLIFSINSTTGAVTLEANTDISDTEYMLTIVAANACGSTSSSFLVEIDNAP